MVTPDMPRLLAYQLRLAWELLLLTVTRHCRHVVRFVGVAASTVPVSTKGTETADAEFAPETSDEHRARALKGMSNQSDKRLGRGVRTLGGSMSVSSLQLRAMFPAVILPGFLLGRPG
jgi:hypothetical protein